MDVHSREIRSHKLKHSHILDYDRVKPCFIKRRKIVEQFSDLRLFQERVHCQIKAAPVEVRLSDRLDKFFF